MDLSARYDEMAKDGAGGVDTTEIDRRLQELHRKLGRRGAEQYAPKYTRHIAEAVRQGQGTGRQVQPGGWRSSRASSRGSSAPPAAARCPRRTLGAVQAGIRQSLAAITAEGRAQKGQLDELQALEKQAEETFLQFQRDDVAQISLRDRGTEPAARRHGRRAGGQPGPEEGRTGVPAQPDPGRGRGHRVRQSLPGGLRPPGMECRELLRECQADLDAAKKAALAEPEDYDAKIAQVESLILDQKKLLADAILYVGKRAELTFSQLKMNLVEIALHEVVKSTGEVKDVFKFTYGGRYYNRLSLSEKIRAGLEVSELVKRLTGRNYPVFIDNMESVDELTNVRPTGQIIMAKCVRGAALTVKPMGRPQVQRAA